MNNNVVINKKMFYLKNKHNGKYVYIDEWNKGIGEYDFFVYHLKESDTLAYLSHSKENLLKMISEKGDSAYSSTPLNELNKDDYEICSVIFE